MPTSHPHHGALVARHSSLVTRYALAPIVLILGGCFSYVTAPVDTVPVGEEVRVFVSRQALQELPDLPNGDTPILAGKLTRRDNERLFISVPVARRQEGFFVSQIGQEVGVRSSEIVQLEMRKLNRTNTALFVGGIGIAAAGVVYAIMEAAGWRDNPDPPVIEEFRIPLFSIPIR